MIKQLIPCALTALTFGVFLSVDAMAVQAANRIAIADTGSITWTSDDAAKDSITGFQLSFKVQTDDDAQISFQFDPDSAANICEYRYHEDKEQLNIYVADPEPLFKGSETMNIGTVSARDAKGGSVFVSIEAIEDSLQYVYGDMQVSASFDAENIEATEPSTDPAESTEPSTDDSTESTEPSTDPTESTEPSTEAPAESTEPSTDPTESIEPSTDPAESAEPSTDPAESTESSTDAPAESTESSTGDSTEPVTDAHIADDDELCKWVVQDYQRRSGITAAEAKITEKTENRYEITLYDDAGNILDTYTIDPSTGVGVNAANEEVSLPQTGNNSLTNILLAFAALMLVAFGLCMVKRSDAAGRRK